MDRLYYFAGYSYARIAYAIALLLALLLPLQAWAHGGGTPILTRIEAGPYWLYVFSEQPTPTAGAEYHISIAVTQPAADGSEAAVGGADVAVVLAPPDSGAPIIAAAEPALASGSAYYEADVTLPEDGAWRVEIRVSSPLGEGSTGYTVNVLAASAGPRWGWIIAGAGSILAGIVVFLVGLRRRPASIEDDEQADGTLKESKLADTELAGN